LTDKTGLSTEELPRRLPGRLIDRISVSVSPCRRYSLCRLADITSVSMESHVDIDLAVERRSHICPSRGREGKILEGEASVGAAEAGIALGTIILRNRGVSTESRSILHTIAHGKGTRSTLLLLHLQQAVQSHPSTHQQRNAIHLYHRHVSTLHL
ncbi:hypothetical protein KCV07_g162, partial [Aureobasidium melanogenum]